MDFYEYTGEPAAPCDVQVMCYHSWNNPTARFVSNTLATLANPDGTFYCIFNHRVMSRSGFGSEVARSKVETREEIVDILLSKIRLAGLTYSDVTRLVEFIQKKAAEDTEEEKKKEN